VHTPLTILIRRGVFHLGYQQVTPHLKLLGEEAPHPKLGICTAFPIFCSVCAPISKFSMSRRPYVKEKDDEKKSDDNETCEKCKNKVESSHHALLCELCEIWFHIKCVNVNKECYEALKVGLIGFAITATSESVMLFKV